MSNGVEKLVNIINCLLVLIVMFGGQQILEEEKVHELLNIGEFPLYMLPIDEDVISFELDLAEKVRNFLIKLEMTNNLTRKYNFLLKFPPLCLLL